MIVKQYSENLFFVDVVRETESALLIRHLGEQIWAPKSILNVACRDANGTVTHVRLPSWFFESRDVNQ